MTLRMNMAGFEKHDIIKSVNIVVTMEKTMILTRLYKNFSKRK